MRCSISTENAGFLGKLQLPPPCSGQFVGVVLDFDRIVTSWERCAARHVSRRTAFVGKESAMSANRPGGSSNSTLYFIVGALIIAVLIIGWFMYGKKGETSSPTP